MDPFDCDIVQYITDWLPFGGPPRGEHCEIFARFGMSPDEVWHRYHRIMNDAQRAGAAGSQERVRKLLHRAIAVKDRFPQNVGGDTSDVGVELRNRQRDGASVSRHDRSG